MQEFLCTPLLVTFLAFIFDFIDDDAILRLINASDAEINLDECDQEAEKAVGSMLTVRTTHLPVGLQ